MAKPVCYQGEAGTRPEGPELRGRGGGPVQEERASPQVQPGAQEDTRLIHNGAPVCESMIILQYIDEVFAGTGPSLLPADPYERAIARFWMAYVDDKLVAPWRQWLRGKTEEEKSEGKKQAFAAVEILEGALRECSKGRGFFGGDGLGLVDVALGGVLSWMKVTEVLSGDKIFDAAKTPLLAAWVERFSELDAAKVALPDVGRLLEFAKAREAAAAPSN
ncbi:hypothetical protein CFC21_087541 [Triticum aestivum]|uniref:GST C-terminal domain-containing protein n=2 Tax=Triticum aestivum TaxID=4565 RepID=A0A9R1IGU3_WHEAT|nr:hypothetical protein CFC21_087541 [Triticum aestivum]